MFIVVPSQRSQSLRGRILTSEYVLYKIQLALRRSVQSADCQQQMLPSRNVLPCQIGERIESNLSSISTRES